MLQPFQDKAPRLLGEVRAHETAVVIGDVELGDGVSLWPHAVLRGDLNRIVVGPGSNIQDGAVVHNERAHPALIGRDCVIGHQACVHGATVGDRCLVGIGALLLNGSVIGDESIVGAGSLVPEGKVIPPRSLVLGVPGRVIRQVSDEELKRTTDGAAGYRLNAAAQLPLLGPAAS
jgi:carbonic anhydrase/acetyltransferase-like protein (isoleucine patch superfamily)